jgi:hypothetical protein
MLGAVLVVLLVLMLIGALPTWGHSRSWGYGPTGGLGLVLAILVVLVALGRIGVREAQNQTCQRLPVADNAHG